STLGNELLRFINQLREADVRVSIAETIDAMNAIAAAGLERTPMREALAATLIKDEDDRHIFDEIFAIFFASGRQHTDDGRRKPGDHSSAAPGAGNVESESPRTAREDKRPSESANQNREPPEESQNGRASEIDEPRGSESSKHQEDSAGAANESEEAGLDKHDGSQSGQRAQLNKILRTPFEQYSDLEYDQARDALAPIARRFRVRLGRRLKMARRGRLDFRRTIRSSIQRGGTLSDLHFRARRPRHIDLLIVADISGSVRYSSTLMLELIAGAADFFRRVRSFVFVDRIAEAELEGRHLVMTPPLDLYARSDFGRVLGELWERRGELLNRASVLVIMGDGRNNRRPARADLIREMARTCRAVIWLIPEERERWGTGDSAIFQYAREVSALVASRNLRELEDALLKVA
ncbi:MAG TPA: VWA domain-containing protein, partial [Candidatus Binataceae bacterium]|nr:VWA domain-containing protein [Candidatus Binataceae bacterium]